MRSRLLSVTALLAACLLLVPTGARADTSQTSIMQDDAKLVDANATTMFTTLARMQQLGVQTIRVNLEWSLVAPHPNARRAPRRFDPTNPNVAYNWTAYDRLVNAAAIYGIGVQFNVTGPGPLWAMGAHPPTTRASTHWEPNPVAFYKFVLAAGRRFSGNDAGVARVSQWSIWNEPNQPGWLAPQWLKLHGRLVAQSPQTYRKLVYSGYYGLLYSGHSTSTDTILIGETAPEGADSGSFYTAMTPLPFLRALYCVNARGQRLRGGAARALGCPPSGSAAAFARANPGLFQATGFAHHPYDFYRTPTAGWKDPNAVPLANIGRLERFLDSTFRAYGVHRQIPLYFTEYGYETNPPDPHKNVSLAAQAAYLNEADYMSWQNPRVRSVAQFLLYDSPPDHRFSPRQYDYWDTFQTGLLFADGRPKPALAAYRMPIWVPRTHLRPGVPARVWGQVRPADAQASQPVAIQWRAGRGGWRTLATVATGADTGYYSASVRLPGSGELRARWSGTVGATISTARASVNSRSVAVSVRR